MEPTATPWAAPADPPSAALPDSREQRTGTAERADIHLALRPGTDGALACAVMHVLFAEGYADWDYMRRYTDCPDELAAHVRTRTPAWAAAITGLPAEEIVAFARLYGRTKRSFIRCHHGFSRSRNGAVNMHAVVCLPAVTGAWQYPGGGALYGHTGLYPIDRTLIEGLDLVDRSIRALRSPEASPRRSRQVQPWTSLDFIPTIGSASP